MSDLREQVTQTDKWAIGAVPDAEKRKSLESVKARFHEIT